MDVLQVGPADLGPLGLTIGAGELGGSAGSAAVTVPLLQPPMADERCFCAHVLRFVHEGVPIVPASCPAYRAGGHCARAGAGLRCAAHEQAGALLWERAQDWRQVEGVGIVHRSLWPAFEGRR